MGSRKRISLHKDMATLEGLARRQGWDVNYTGAGHQEWKAPNGEVVSSASTGTSRSVINTKALLKGQGMLLDLTEIRQYERAKRRVEQAYRNSGLSDDELNKAMPETVFFLDKLVTGEGTFDLKCVCGVLKAHPLGFVTHIQSCPEARDLAAERQEEEEKKGKGMPSDVPEKCDKGHALTPETVYIWPDGSRWDCKVCRRERQAEARRQKAEAAALPQAPAPVEEVVPLLEEVPQPVVEEPDIEMPVDISMRELADNVLAAALEAAGRPTEEEVAQQIEVAVAQARAEERASGEDLMNELIAMTEERDQLRHQVDALTAKCNGLESRRQAPKGGVRSDRISRALNS